MAEWQYYNPNPKRGDGLDCTIRAICAVTDLPWETVYAATALEGYIDGNVQDANTVWIAFLRRLGFRREIIPNSCPDCYTVADFADDHPTGRYVLGTGSHAVAIVDGIIKDLFDSSGSIPIYYLYKED